MATGAWTAEKVATFRARFEIFLNHAFINSKETGGHSCLGALIYLAQKIALAAIFGGLTLDKHDFKFLKSRQLGISTITRALVVFWCGVHRGIQAAMIFDTTANTENGRREIEDMIDNIPAFLKFPKVKTRNRYGIILDNGSKIQFMSAGVRNSRTSGGLGRSSGFNVIWAKMCSWENPEGIESLKQSLSETYENRLFIWESPLALDTPLLTPHGWTTIGAVQVGDFVFDENGQPTEVVGLSPIFNDRMCFEITFGTGEKIVSDAAHKWQVERMGSSRSRWSTKVVTTEQLDSYRDRIWLGDPVEGFENDLPINPYFVGAWLGDGHTEAVRITCGDKDMEEMRRNLKERGIACGPITKFKGRGGGVFGAHGQMPVFRALNLIGNKHIPELYLRSSIEDRLELLRGLMDTDGSIVENGNCLFTNSSKALVNNVCELLASLGLRYNVNWVEASAKKFTNGKYYDCRPYAMIGFMPPEGMKVFALKRKLDRQNTGFKSKPRRSRVARIISITPCRSVPVRCLAVDTPTHLFKVGRTLIPTHNTGRGFNDWHTMWQEAVDDVLNQVATFIGWWAKDNQRIDRDNPMFAKYGVQPITQDEQKRIDLVKTLYNFDVTIEQVAWYRRKMDPTRSLEPGDAEDSNKLQEQPWTADEAFQATGSTFFAADRLGEMMAVAAREKSKGYKYYPGTDFLTCDFLPARTYRDVMLKVWQEPDQNGEYVIAADPAFGHDERNDRSACQVIRCYADGVEQVAEFANASTPTNQFAWLIAALVGWYKNVTLIIEINGPGEAVWGEYKGLKQLVTQGYLRGMAQEKGLRDIFNNTRNYIFTRSDSMGMGSNYHWITNTQRKIAIMERLRDCANTDEILIRSLDTLEEMRSITRDGDTIKAEGRKKDDRVLALAMAVRAWEERVRRSLINQNRTRKAEAARLSASPQSRYNVFSQYQIDQIFKQKQKGRAMQAIAARRDAWKHR